MLSDIPHLFSLYQKAGVEGIGVYAISDKGRLEVMQLNLTSGGIARLKLNRLKELNLRGEGIYFAPKIDTCQMLFLDEKACLYGLRCGTMVVQTSARKHQAHIPYVGQPASISVRTRFQRHLRSVYHSDSGALSANHPRRLPGFTNQKYPDKPLVQILSIVADGEFLSYEELMEAVLKQETQA